MVPNRLLSRLGIERFTGQNKNTYILTKKAARQTGHAYASVHDFEIREGKRPLESEGKRQTQPQPDRQLFAA